MGDWQRYKKIHFQFFSTSHFFPDLNRYPSGHCDGGFLA